MRILALLLALFAPPLAAQTVPADQTSPSVLSFEAGIICAVAPDRIDEAPDTVSGTKHVVEERPPFVSNSRRVPAVLGVGFGVSAQAVSPNGISNVTMVVTHPPFTGSDATRQSLPTRIPGGEPGITFYQFDYDYELALGHWRLTTLSPEGEVLFSVPFEVVPARAVPDLARVCDYEELLG